MVQRALLSVSDKTQIVELAQGLTELGVEILSTGGTFKQLKASGISVTEVSEYTGFPEIMDGRVKTLHPKIHGGILGRRDTDSAVMETMDIGPIDLVVVNLYPFQATIAKPDCTLANAIENIDIGGPTMVRAAAKNHAHVGIVVDPNDYAAVLSALRNERTLPHELRFNLALKAFQHTADYDSAIAKYLTQQANTAEESAADDSQFPNQWPVQWSKQQDLRYGENPHQAAAFYKDATSTDTNTVATAVQIQGKALSFNNIADTDAALECVKQFDAPACVIVKHANPCGVAIGTDVLEAYNKAFATDPTSAFGGIIAINRPLDDKLAQHIINRQFVEVIVAPEATAQARNALAAKPNVRLLECGPLTEAPSDQAQYEIKQVAGGALIQTLDTGMVQAADLQVVTTTQPTPTQITDLLFAWKVAKYVKSNAIVYAKDTQTIGVGAGQMSRVYSAQIANIKAQDGNLEVAGSVMASDAFFPFRDGIDAAASVGIKAIIQPGGSIRDEEVIQAANEASIAMVFTGMRHFKH